MSHTPILFVHCGLLKKHVLFTRRRLLHRCICIFSKTQIKHCAYLLKLLCHIDYFFNILMCGLNRFLSLSKIILIL